MPSPETVRKRELKEAHAKAVRDTVDKDARIAELQRQIAALRATIQRMKARGTGK